MGSQVASQAYVRIRQLHRHTFQPDFAILLVGEALLVFERDAPGATGKYYKDAEGKLSRWVLCVTNLIFFQRKCVLRQAFRVCRKVPSSLPHLNLKFIIHQIPG